jgi:hypothetical protein
LDATPTPLSAYPRSWRFVLRCAFLVLISGAVVAGMGLGFPMWPAGLAAWVAGLLLWPRLDKRQKRLCLILAGLGGTGLFWASFHGKHEIWLALLTQNTALLAMLACVSFLQILRLPGGDAPLPKGAWALWRTLGAVHLLGAFINMSVLFIMADRMARTGPLSLAQASLLVRGFLSAALWSPFFAATAVALTYAPGSRLSDLALLGMPMALTLLLWGGFQSYHRLPEHAASFEGYPFSLSALLLPLALAILVVIGHSYFPTWDSLAVISASAVLLSGLWVIASSGLAKGGERLIQHVSLQLPAMHGEMALFLAAAVFSAGLQGWMSTGLGFMPFGRFGPVEASICLAIMMGLAFLGVHAVVSIVLFSVWLAPLSPDPLLLAFIFVQNWAIGLAGGPLAGVHLALSGRYGLSAASLARLNLPYCLGGYVLAVMWIVLYTQWLVFLF